MERLVETQKPFFRESGVGPSVICLHSNASSSSQWRALTTRIEKDFTVYAPDLYGAGKSPQWPSNDVMSLADEISLIDPILGKASSPCALIGHSYGAAVALVAALANPEKVRTLVLYEPTLFSLLIAEYPLTQDADGIRAVVNQAGRFLDSGEKNGAAECFIDYWATPGTWKNIPDSQKQQIAESITNVRRWAHALFTEPTKLDAFRNLSIPILYMYGEQSTQSAHGVGRLLTKTLPNIEVVPFSNLGHMGPVTNPDTVNNTIIEFLARKFVN